MTPLERYQLDIEQRAILSDDAQKIAVDYTQKLYATFLEQQNKKQKILNRLSGSLLNKSKTPIKGIYLWGGVGRGKTYSVDMFFDCLPLERKLRIHFNRFMYKIHHELKLLKDVVDPIKIVADKFAESAKIICFDEFHVSDITDAMLLGGLFQALFERGVTLVATSNEHPDHLYWEGLQRERFLPAIDLIKKHTHIINVDSATDYRLLYLDRAEIYHSPLDERAEKCLIENFKHIAPDAGKVNQVIVIVGREIETVRCADGVVWFEFKAICDGPRGPTDYIEISRLYQTVLIANIPKMQEDHNDMVKRLITLVDEFYDRNVKLILTAATAPEALYQGKRLAKPFKRTISRLHEMQAHDYLAKPHLPE